MTNYRDTASNSRKAGHDPRCGRERRKEARRVGLEHKGSGPKRNRYDGFSATCADIDNAIGWF